MLREAMGGPGSAEIAAELPGVQQELGRYDGADGPHPGRARDPRALQARERRREAIQRERGELASALPLQPWGGFLARQFCGFTAWDWSTFIVASCSLPCTRAS